ncbi:hypothetical protein MPNT_10459 [Candidatus Methylacidithermus pantelleriae]|uniref:Uncharacterized protein n=1 Tax=Candidatus Methylacidithermus pantelleriae TaxID=2744239 RepID=A0A8J2BM52_9BACT|nr:hypothetical protein MPNT_10459 [Candidatus Methylacidithermus pantelleriae]
MAAEAKPRYGHGRGSLRPGLLQAFWELGGFSTGEGKALLETSKRVREGSLPGRARVF